MRASTARLCAAVLLIQSCHHHQPVLQKPDLQARAEQAAPVQEEQSGTAKKITYGVIGGLAAAFGVNLGVCLVAMPENGGCGWGWHPLLTLLAVPLGVMAGLDVAEGGDSEAARLQGVFRAMGVEMAGRPIRLHPMWNAPVAVLSLENRTREIPPSLREAYRNGGGVVASWPHAACTGPGERGCEELRDLDLLWVADDASWDGDRVEVRVGWVSFGGDGAVEVRREVREYDCDESACQRVNVVDKEAPE